MKFLQQFSLNLVYKGERQHKEVLVWKIKPLWSCIGSVRKPLLRKLLPSTIVNGEPPFDEIPVLTMQEIEDYIYDAE